MGNINLKACGLILATAFLTAQSYVTPISSSAQGTYAVLRKDNTFSGLFYRLVMKDGKWIMYGKKPDVPWKNITCDKGCGYENATDKEIAFYFPEELRKKMDITCIRNVAQAFCRYNQIGNPDSVAYVVIGLVTGKPVPIFLKRVPSDKVP